MRYVDCGAMVLPSGWLVKANAAKAKVTAGDDPNDYDSVWREMKDALGALLHDKCWYCETPITRSDNAVDHFRPKGRVSDATRPHNGYRWLAFEMTNYRYSCTYCNSRRKDVENGTAGGKADRFPLLHESCRLYGPGCLSQEAPALLDPCELGDWELLGCQQEDGKPCATGADPVDIERASISIEVYHLHHVPTCTARHRVAVSFLSTVRLAKEMFSSINNDPQRRDEFKKLCALIYRAIDRRAEYSGEMIFLLKGQRSEDHPWIQQLLAAV